MLQKLYRWSVVSLSPYVYLNVVIRPVSVDQQLISFLFQSLDRLAALLSLFGLILLLLGKGRIGVIPLVCFAINLPVIVKNSGLAIVKVKVHPLDLLLGSLCLLQLLGLRLLIVHSIGGGRSPVGIAIGLDVLVHCLVLIALGEVRI